MSCCDFSSLTSFFSHEMGCTSSMLHVSTEGCLNAERAPVSTANQVYGSGSSLGRKVHLVNFCLQLTTTDATLLSSRRLQCAPSTLRMTEGGLSACHYLTRDAGEYEPDRGLGLPKRRQETWLVQNLGNCSIHKS